MPEFMLFYLFCLAARTGVNLLLKGVWEPCLSSG